MALLSSIIAINLALAPLPSLAKKWTVAERIDKVSKAIDKGRDDNELTTKQLQSLKSEMSDIKSKFEKVKGKNATGKISLEDRRKLHKDLNELCVKLLRYRLDNVYN